jgi:organic hydroperoxide reductase OsmC/OhrA
MRAYNAFRYGQTTWSSARRGLLSAADKPNIVVVGSPPEFKGEPDIWAPEELLVGSVNTCMMLTFLSLAQAQGLIPQESHAKVPTDTDRTSDPVSDDRTCSGRRYNDSDIDLIGGGG